MKDTIKSLIWEYRLQGLSSYKLKFSLGAIIQFVKSK